MPPNQSSYPPNRASTTSPTEKLPPVFIAALHSLPMNESLGIGAYKRLLASAVLKNRLLFFFRPSNSGTRVSDVSLFRAEAEYRPVLDFLGAAVVGDPQATDGRVTSEVRPHGHAGGPSDIPWRRVPSSARTACRPHAHRSWLPRCHQCPACCLQAAPDPSQVRSG